MNGETDLINAEHLTMCSFCELKFNQTDHCPKILQCKHYFCLKCIETTMIEGQELTCVHCWKRQDIKAGEPASLPTQESVLSLARCLTWFQFKGVDDKQNSKACIVHGPSWTLWCHTCHRKLCRVCYLIAEHTGHHVTSTTEAWDLFVNMVQSDATEVAELVQEIYQLNVQQREFKHRIIEACVAVKTLLEASVGDNALPADELREVGEVLQHARPDSLAATSLEELETFWERVRAKKLRLKTKHNEMTKECQFEGMVSAADVPLSPASSTSLLPSDWSSRGQGSPSAHASSNSPIVLLANYCAYQLSPSCRKPLCRAWIGNPHFYFDIEIDQVYAGRFVIETRPNLAPKMSRNFAALVTGENGYSYKNCSIFQCWAGESIITGDCHNNTGRGGKTSWEENLFMPDESKLTAVRGAVGMRRTQKKHDHLGLVGSQFRIILKNFRSFSAIFGQVVKGMELIEEISNCGDLTGKPTKNIVIASCGKM